MSTSEISFSFQDNTSSSFPLSQKDVRQWLHKLSLDFQKPIAQLDYVFCTDAFLLEMNRHHLNHDDYTDIITFPYSYSPITSEIYISCERALENSKTFDVAYSDELLRLIAHGFLHMCGFKDHTDDEKHIMRQKENYCLSIF